GSCDCSRGRDERDRRHDHFIAWSDAERFERHLESHSAIHRAQPEAALLERGKLLLESRDYRVISAPFIARENFLEKFAFARSGDRPVGDFHVVPFRIKDVSVYEERREELEKH